MCTLFRFTCAVCDVMTPVRDHHLVSPSEIPHREILRATDNLRKHERVMSFFYNYPHDPDGFLDGLVLTVHGFDEENNRGKLHVCKVCHRSLSNRKFPEAALANGFGVGDMPSKVDGATVIERAAAYAVRVKGHVIAQESRKIRMYRDQRNVRYEARLCFMPAIDVLSHKSCR
ncbi:unnamed protein product [Laminaria digitata]